MGPVFSLFLRKNFGEKLKNAPYAVFMICKKKQRRPQGDRHIIAHTDTAFEENKSSSWRYCRCDEHKGIRYSNQKKCKMKKTQRTASFWEDEIEYYVCPGKPLSGWQKISDGLIKCACKQVYRGSMLVTELFTFNLTCVILLMALYGVALNITWALKIISYTPKETLLIQFTVSHVWQA